MCQCKGVGLTPVPLRLSAGWAGREMDGWTFVALWWNMLICNWLDAYFHLVISTCLHGFWVEFKQKMYSIVMYIAVPTWNYINNDRLYQCCPPLCNTQISSCVSSLGFVLIPTRPKQMIICVWGFSELKKEYVIVFCVIISFLICFETYFNFSLDPNGCGMFEASQLTHECF